MWLEYNQRKLTLSNEYIVFIDTIWKSHWMNLAIAACVVLEFNAI